MAVPPEYWLQRIYDYDAELVVFPSRYVPYAYVLARRRRMRVASLDEALAATVTQPDTRLCLQRGLVPVALIHRNGTSWSIDNIIATLQRRDIWRVGGGDKMADLHDNTEAAQDEQTRKQIRDDMWMRSGQAWESYQRRSGQRVSSPGLGSGRQSPTARSSSGSTPRTGSVILTDAV